MSQFDHTPAARPRIGADKIILGALAILMIGAFFYVSSQRQQQLRTSPTGLNGLQVWLASEGQTARNFSGSWPLNIDEVGLLVLPIYDTALDEARTLARSKEDWITQQDEYDLDTAPILAKIADVPTLLVLPKWRSGMRLTGLAHPLLLAEQTRLQDTLKAVLQKDDVRLDYGRTPFSTFPYQTTAQDPLSATVYAAQMFTAKGCKPIVGTAKTMILGACELPSGTKVFVLSDPDLINNHGLALGDNAFIIKDFIAQTANDQQIIIDYSRKSWLTRDSDEPQRERTWADLKRFLEPPFTLMWVGLAIAVALVLWRAAMRFGPLIATGSGLGASKLMAIGARARLMRLAGRDGALVADYGKARLAATATALVGAAHANHISHPDTFLAYTQRRHPKHAPALTKALNTISALPPSASATHAMAAVASLDSILEQITHDT
ncbi:hypothetical protein [Tateyamaria sp.]|uniref:hypothetical protein n=1 Tax=Tateyamaria sp. TaxID=1929288 RepID=UPI00329FE976